jgi:hypothetical protein
MARAYSQDLRDRVIDAALGGMLARRAAAQFEIGGRRGDCAGAQGARKRSADGTPSGPAAALQARSAARFPARSGRTDAGHDDYRDATAFFSDENADAYETTPRTFRPKKRAPWRASRPSWRKMLARASLPIGSHRKSDGRWPTSKIRP